MPAEPIDRHLGFLLNDVARLLRTRFDQKARRLGLTRAQWSVLAWASRCEGVNQKALADRLDLEPITLARILDRLEAAGFVERRADPADRRVRLIYLREAAHPVLAAMREIGAEVRKDALASVSGEDRERLIDTLLTMKGNLLADPQADAVSEGKDR